MTALRIRVGQWAAGNWFWIAAPFLLAASLAFTRTVDWRTEASMAELVTLFDWCVSVPALYWLCYRRTLSTGQMALRLMGLACLGVTIASWLIPAEAQSILKQLSWARWAGLIILALVELRIMIAMIKLAFSGTAKTEDLVASGAPPLLARLMLLEARFWRALWRLIRGR